MFRSNHFSIKKRNDLSIKHHGSSTVSKLFVHAKICRLLLKKTLRDMNIKICLHDTKDTSIYRFYRLTDN